VIADMPLVGAEGAGAGTLVVVVGVARLACGARTTGVAVAGGVGIGWIVTEAGVGEGVGDAPRRPMSKSPTGGVMIVGCDPFWPAAGAASSNRGISAVVARRVQGVTRGR
jgi:hypothetical protein